MATDKETGFSPGETNVSRFMLFLDGRRLRDLDEELQLDVVWIAEHDDDSTWDAVRVRDRGVLNAEFFEP